MKSLVSWIPLTLLLCITFADKAYGIDKEWSTDGCDAFVDIVFIIDASDNNPEDNRVYDTILRFSADLSDTFRLGSDYTQIAAVVYSDVAKKELDLSEITDHVQFRKALFNMTSMNKTDTPKPYHGLDLIVDMFSSDLGGRYIAGKIAVLIMTKLSDIPEYTKNSAKRLQEQGVAILIVAVDQEVRSEPVILNSDKKDFFLVEKLNDLWRVKNKITSRICEGRLELR
ncbi:hypothetical protein Btru_055643 [Bulinus truncatus]|nr:hypothetical protein Btru_055643 [Bulinus truncatus]